MNIRKLVFVLVMVFSSFSLYTQSGQKNLEKYWYYRYCLIGSGVSLPLFEQGVIVIKKFF